jgi:hypothetical protein
VIRLRKSYGATRCAPEPETMLRLNHEETALDRCEDAEKTRRCRGRGGAGAEIRYTPGTGKETAPAVIQLVPSQNW